MGRGVGLAAAVVLATISACDGARGPAGGEGEGLEYTSAIHLSLVGPGGFDALPAQVSVRRVADGKVYLIQCAATGRSPALGDACEELVLPAGAYEVVAQPRSARCRSERGHYDVVVEPGQTAELSVPVQCAPESAASEVVVMEQGAPLVAALDVVGHASQGERSVCVGARPQAVVRASVFDADTACEELRASWTATAGLAVDFDAAVGADCAVQATFPADGPLGDYEIALVVSDPDGQSTSLRFPVHLVDCRSPPSE